jgi:hypothetical protein
MCGTSLSLTIRVHVLLGQLYAAGVATKIAAAHHAGCYFLRLVTALEG